MQVKRFFQPWPAVAGLSLLLLLTVSLGHWRAAGVGPQVQVPMFYDAHYLFPRPWTQAQEAPGVPPPAPLAALYGPNQVSQPFVARADRLSLLRVWLAGPPGSQVEVVLTGPEGSVWRGVAVLAGANGRFYNLSLPPLSGVQGQRFQLTLRAPQATLADPVITRAVGGDRLGGAIYLNEYSRPGNLELYTYAAGRPGRWWLQAVGEQILPAAFALRVQQYKPEPFKGAAFPALLALTLLLTALFLLLAWPGASSLSQAAGWGLAGLLLVFLVWQAAGQRLLLPPLANRVALTPGPAVDGWAAGANQARLVQDFSLTKWTARRLPEERLVGTDWVAAGEAARRPSIRVPANSSLNYALTMPLNGRFHSQIAVDGPGELRFSLQWAGQEIAGQTITAQDGPAWFEADLSAWAGQESHLRLITEPLSGQPDGLWLWPQLTADHTWLLEPTAAEPTWQPAAAYFDQQVALVGYDWPEALAPGEPLTLTLYWQALVPLSDHATIFVHLLDETGQIVAQHDGPAVGGTYPLPAWPVGQIVVDTRRLHLPETAVGDDYQLAVGLYDPATLSRWSAATPAGQPLPDDRVLLLRP